jgi:hypothetical protein
MDSRRESANTNLDDYERSAFQRCVEIRRRLNCAVERRRKQHSGSPNRLETIGAAPEQNEPYAGISAESRVDKEVGSTRRTAANDNYSDPIANAVASRHFLGVSAISKRERICNGITVYSDRSKSRIAGMSVVEAIHLLSIVARICRDSSSDAIR